MTNEVGGAGPGVIPGLVDLDVLLKDVAPLTTPHDWAAPDLFPDDAEFNEFVRWVRAERNTNLA
jgi:hypothetical protein